MDLIEMMNVDLTPSDVKCMAETVKKRGQDLGPTWCTAKEVYTIKVSASGTQSRKEEVIPNTERRASESWKRESRAG